MSSDRPERAASARSASAWRSGTRRCSSSARSRWSGSLRLLAVIAPQQRDREIVQTTLADTPWPTSAAACRARRGSIARTGRRAATTAARAGCRPRRAGRRLFSMPARLEQFDLGQLASRRCSAQAGPSLRRPDVGACSRSLSLASPDGALFQVGQQHRAPRALLRPVPRALLLRSLASWSSRPGRRRRLTRSALQPLRDARRDRARHPGDGPPAARACRSRVAVTRSTSWRAGQRACSIASRR